MAIEKFLTVGILLGLPFGPIGIMCMGKTIEKGRGAGFASALGAVSVDIIYSIIAFLILIPAKGFIDRNEFVLKIIVGLFLLVVGGIKVFGKVAIKNLDKADGEIQPKESFRELGHEYAKIFLLSIPNVFNVVTIITIFTGLRIFALTESFLIPKLVFGILVGSLILWTITITILNSLRKKITEKTIERVVRLCGLAIAVFGILLEFQAFSTI
ncbi:MAG: LysE family transporter [Fusobacteriaceae bacterium]